MLTLHNTNEVPPGGFRYFQKETGIWLNAPSLTDLCSMVKKHRKANNLPIGAEFSAEIEDQLCQNCPPEICTQNSNTYTLHQAGSVSFATAIQTAAMLTEWFIKRGAKRVEIDHATRRAAICVQCPRNQPIEGCSACNLGIVRRAVEKIVGGARTEFNHRLHACSICGCTLRAKIHLPIDLLRSYLTEEKLSQFPDYCWVKKEANE